MQFTIPVYLQNTSLGDYFPRTKITLATIPFEHYVGQFSCYYDKDWIGERHVLVSLTGDGGVGGKFADSVFGRDVLSKGFVVLEPIEPADSVTGDLSRVPPFSVDSSTVDTDPRHLMRSRAGHLHRILIEGLLECDRRMNLSDNDPDKLKFTFSGKYTFLCQSRGSRSAFYLANSRLTYPPDLKDVYKYLNRVDYWFLAGFPFETDGNNRANNPTLSSMSFSNMVNTSPRKSKIIIVANDTDGLTGSDIRRILMYCVSDKRREDMFFLNLEENGHFVQGVTQLSFLDCIINDKPLTLTFINTPDLRIPLVNLLGSQGKKSSEVFPTPPAYI